MLMNIAGVLYATIGVHPCSCLQFTKHDSSPDIFLAQVKALALSGKESGHAVAFGEIGLDYDRLYLCPKDTQLKFFAKQLDVAVEVQMPLFLHSRAAHADFVRLLKEREDSLPRRGVVHSFTGTMEEMKELVEMGWDIGVNGCSLKTMENCEVVKHIPLERLQLETDGPWCEIRASHASSRCLHDFKEEGKWKWVKKEKWEEGSLVKGRNESALIGKVAWVVAKLKNVSLEVLCEAAWANSVRMFGLGEGKKIEE
jgi:TatD DNase family protein